MLIFFAKWFAIFAHTSVFQRRKYTGEPYWRHPEQVADLVESVDGDCYQIAAAWLHDTVEDTWVPLWLIRLLFSGHVADLVKGLTDVSKKTDGNRAFRKSRDRAHTAKQSPRCKTIKLADLIVNSRSIFKYDPKFSKTYAREKELLLQVLKEGNASLYVIAERILIEYKASVEK